MTSLPTLNSLSIFVGTGQCNANCAHCAGIMHRKNAPKQDGIINENLIYKTLKEAHERGARYLSISSSGEPTLSPLSVTAALELVHRCKKEGLEYSPINLYSNGIKIGEDKEFCDIYLPLWRNLGLTTIYVTVHDIDEKKNAKIYGVKSYPSLKLVLSRIHESNLLMRANLVLNRRTIDTFEKFVSTASYLKNMGVDYISAWPIRGMDDKINQNLSPLEKELNKMEAWIKNNQSHKYGIRLLREKNQGLYRDGRKITLFPDGTLSSAWCN